MTAQSPELQNQINNWRIKAIEGTLTTEEARESIKALRAGRLAAQEASARSKSRKAKKPVKNADDMLGELEGL